MVAAMGKISQQRRPYVIVRGLRRGHRLGGIVGRLGSWLGLDGEVRREGPRRELGRLSLNLKGVVGVPYVIVRGLRRGHRLRGIVGRLGSWLGLDGEVGREGPRREQGRLALNGDGELDLLGIDSIYLGLRSCFLT